jgi:hypothetical protein
MLDLNNALSMVCRNPLFSFAFTVFVFSHSIHQQVQHNIWGEDGE